ncbi:hypothetical protein ACWTU6_20320 [Mesorhizobium sp. BHbsci]
MVWAADTSGLRRAVDRLQHDDDYIASAYQDWAGSRVDLTVIAEKLVATVDAVIQAGLCRRPWSSKPSFMSDVAKIASHSGLEFDTLLAFLREAEALRAFRAGLSTNGLLAAARDRKQEDVPGSDRG